MWGGGSIRVSSSDIKLRISIVGCQETFQTFQNFMATQPSVNSHLQKVDFDTNVLKLGKKKLKIFIVLLNFH